MPVLPPWEFRWHLHPSSALVSVGVGLRRRCQLLRGRAGTRPRGDAHAIAAQSSVEWDERGEVTGANLFSRSVGSAVGVAIFGAVATGIFLVAGPAASRASADYPATVVAASGAVFFAVAVSAAFTVAETLSMPRVPLRDRAA